MVGIKAGDFGVVIASQVDEFTCSWFVEHLAAWSQIYPGFTIKVLTLTEFLLEPKCVNFSLWDQAIVDIFTNSTETP